MATYRIPTVRYDPRFTQRAGLLSQEGIGLPINAGRTPILNPSPNPTAAARPALQPQTNATGNRRMSSRIPNQQIDMNTEGFMRIGGDMMGAASQGALPALSAGFQRYGDIMDYNRRGKMAEYEQQMLRANEEAERQRLALKMQQDAAKDSDVQQADVINARNQIENMETMLEALKEGGLTGLMDGTATRWMDRLGISDWWSGSGTNEGSKREYIRKLLQEFKVDQTLTKTANTKGAISNQEMNLFMSPFPSIALDNEEVWIATIQQRLEIARKILASVEGGTGDYQIEEVNP
jgi:hypothetical protein